MTKTSTSKTNTKPTNTAKLKANAKSASVPSNVAAIAATYDNFPYESKAFHQTAFAHLFSVARLFGLAAPLPEKARVLELGCASGGNLFDLAARYPHAHFHGIDLSKTQIDEGLAMVKQLGLSNIKLAHRSILDIKAEDGLYDYIICHGVYSWVPPEVQTAILRICSENLSPNGVAYVSYNTYPGWKMSEVVREAMLFRAKHGANPKQQLSFARGMVDFLADKSPAHSVAKGIMQEHQALFSRTDESYQFHEFLELHNAPCYFGQFVERAAEQGLAYLAEAEVQSMYISNLGAELADLLIRECGQNQVAIEQYIDFLNNRKFRQTLLVHADKASSLNYSTSLAIWSGMAFKGRYKQDEQNPARYISMRGPAFTISLPWQAAVLNCLSEHFPAYINSDAIFKLLPKEIADICNPDVIAQFLSSLVVMAAVQFSTAPNHVAYQVKTKPDDKPVADAFVRAFAKATINTPQCGTLTNVFHETVKFVPAYIAFLAAADGTKTIAELNKIAGIETDLNLLYENALMVD